MRNLNVFILLGVLITSCIQKTPISDQLVILDSLKSEELRLALITDINEVKWISDSIKSFWTPNQSQLYAIDSIVMKAITDNKETNKLIKNDSYKKYFRQLVCLVKENGDSVVFLNAVCQIHDGPITVKVDSVRWGRFDWQHHLLQADDGGPCFWRIWIDFSKRNYYNFMVN